MLTVSIAIAVGAKWGGLAELCAGRGIVVVKGPETLAPRHGPDGRPHRGLEIGFACLAEPRSLHPARVSSGGFPMSEGGASGAGRLIEWTGERCVPWTEDASMVYEHYHRYLWAAGVVSAADWSSAGT